VQKVEFSWAQAGPTVLAAFLASTVEFVEALTVVLAVGSVRGWRSALSGSASGLALLVILTLAFGPLLAAVPLALMQLVAGTLLLLFGLRWLRKAVLRTAGILPHHDEAAAYAAETARLSTAGIRRAWDRAAFATSFQITLIEGMEVVFIVLAVGAGSGALLRAAGAGALAALVLVIALGVALHRPLARVPENALKFTVGVVLSGFGTFWVGEGLGLPWPGSDLSLPALCAGFLATAWLAVTLCRRVRA